MLTREQVEKEPWLGDQRQQVLELIAALEKAKGEGFVECFNTWRNVLVEHDVFIGDEPIPTRQHIAEAFAAHDGRVEVTVLNAAVQANKEAFPIELRAEIQGALDGTMQWALGDKLRALDTGIMRRTLELLRQKKGTP